MRDRPPDRPGRPDEPEMHWMDDDAGPIVRAYAVTGGRVRPVAGGFDLVAFVVSRATDSNLPAYLSPEQRAILAASAEPLSVAEVAAKLNLALGVIRVLLGDLLAADLISMYEPPAARRHDEDILKAVVNGLRAL